MSSHALGRLRLATALGHALPGGRVDVLLRHGRVLRADHDKTSGAAITPCELRSMIVSKPCMSVLDFAAEIEEITVHAPRVCDAGGGVYRGIGENGVPNAWFASYLAPATVGAILDEVPVDGRADAIHATLQPDCVLGVVVVLLEADAPGDVELLDDVARNASAACYAQELIYAARHPEVIE